MKNYFLLLAVLMLLSSGVSAQKKAKGVPLKKLNQSYLNWQNLDPATDKIMGVSVDKAYNELLKDKKAKKTIVVAVIDGGVDIHHEDFKGKIWVNEKEIPNNGIDDDNNGYIDDINGWNFIGNEKGDVMTYSHTEDARLVRKYHNKFKNVKSKKGLSAEDAKKYEIYKKCYKSYAAELAQKEEIKKKVQQMQFKIKKALHTLSAYAKDGKISSKALPNIQTKTTAEKEAKEYLLKKFKMLPKSDKLFVSPKIYDYILEQYVGTSFKYYLNTDWDARALIGDNEDDMSDTHYGNNIVDGKGYGSGHGTFVSGLIAANRNNGIGINGIADNVKIMALRVVPDGDEYDKDVALAIKYAIDNGAQIINMSFGKYFSENKYMVDRVLDYAKDKNVLLFHAAGNEALNNDVTEHYPTPEIGNNVIVPNFLVAGASSKEAGVSLVGGFSNYGRKTVDFFAPGVSIISTYPQNTYKLASGTSFACPVSAGVAALVWSYYPELSAQQLKEVLFKSVTPYDSRVKIPGKHFFLKRKSAFRKLSITGGIVNAYKALQEAEKLTKK